MQTTISLLCSFCEKSFDKNRSEYNRSIKSNYKNFFCSKKCSHKNERGKMEILGPKIRNKNIEIYNKNPKICPNCNSVIDYDKKENDFCSSRCAAIHTQKDGGRCWSKEDRKRISIWAKKHAYRPKKLLIKKICVNCKEEYDAYPKKKTICCSHKCYATWCKKTGYMKGRNGGFRLRGGRGKQGWYKGFHCQSSWELAWIIYQIDHKNSIERNTQGFEYQFEGKTLKYYPDFRLLDGSYVEVKGYNSKQWEAKKKQFPYKLDIVDRKKIKPYIEYVIKKYGENFIQLYEKTI